MQAACKYKERSDLGHMQIHLSTPACCLLPAFQEEMWHLCCWASASPLHVFVIRPSGTQILLVFLKLSTFVLSQGSAYTAPGFSVSGLWKHYSPFSSPWKTVGNLLERKAIAWGSKWIQGRSRVVWAQVIYPPVSQSETVESVHHINQYTCGNHSWPGVHSLRNGFVTYS